MPVPVHKNPSSDLTIFVDPSWLITSEKYLISHALETVLAELGSEQIIQRKVDEFVNGFNEIYQPTEYDIENFCIRLKQSMPSQDTAKLLEFIGLRNTVSSCVTQNFNDIADCLQRVFEFRPDKLDMSLHHEVLCSGIEYAVNNIRRNKSIIMITGSPAKTDCRRVIEMAEKRNVKIHVLFATSGVVAQDDIAFYQYMTNTLHGQFFELRRSIITEMKLEQIFRSIIVPTGLATMWLHPQKKPNSPYSHLAN